MSSPRESDSPYPLCLADFTTCQNRKVGSHLLKYWERHLWDRQCGLLPVLGEGRAEGGKALIWHQKGGPPGLY